MNYKCPGCGSIVTKEKDTSDCSSCGESLVQFWHSIASAEQKKNADESRNRILTEMQECSDNLEKGFQELLTGKMNGAMKVYFEKIASENNPSQFAEYSDKEEYKSAYKKLASKYESYANLLNAKAKSAKTIKFGIIGAIAVFVLVGGIATLSSLTRKETNITVEGGKSEVAVNVNNNTGSSSTSNTNVDSNQNSNGGTNVNVNNNITVDNKKRSKYDSYVFESGEDCINYFLKTNDWNEKAKCCNYPDNAITLLNAIKNEKGSDFFSKYKISKKEKNGDKGGLKFTLKGGEIPLTIYTNSKEYGCRISLWSSLYSFGYNEEGFFVEKSETNAYKWDIYVRYDTSNWDFGNNTGKKINKYNTKNSYSIWGYWKDGKQYNDVPDNIIVKKDSTVGKKAYELLKDGNAHKVSFNLVWDNDNYYTLHSYDGTNEKYYGAPIIILKGIEPCLDVGYVESSNELCELQQNYVPAPKL